MKKNYILPLVAIFTILFFLNACHSKPVDPDIKGTTSVFPSTPQELDDYMLRISDTLLVAGHRWAALLKERNFSEMAALRKNLFKYIDSEVINVSNMQDVCNSEKYRKAVITNLQVEKDLLLEAWGPFDTLDKSATDAVINDLINKASAVLQRENKVGEALDIARHEYCQTCNIVCEDR